MTVRKSRCGLAAAVVMSVVVVASCGGGDPTPDRASPPLTTEDADDPYLATAARAVELFGSFPDAGVAILLAADAGYGVDQIIEAIDTGGLRADGSITDGDDSDVAPLGPATDAIETAAGRSIAAVALVVVREPLRLATTPEDLRDRFAEIERDVQQAFGNDDNMNYYLLAAILRALKAGLDGDELVESVVTGRLPDHVVAAQVFKRCSEADDGIDDYGPDMENCLTNGQYGNQSDSIAIMALGILDAERAEYDFYLEDLCRQAANPNPDECGDYLKTEELTDGTEQQASTEPDNPEPAVTAVETPTRAKGGRWTGSATTSHEGASLKTEYQGSATIELRDGVYSLTFEIISDSTDLGHTECTSSSIIDGEATAKPNEYDQLVFTTSTVREIASDCPFYESRGGYFEEETDYTLVGYLLDNDVIRLDLLVAASVEMDWNPL